MSNRFDHRSESRFKKDIKYTTKLEGYFFEKWLDHSQKDGTLDVFDFDDNGADNSGAFIKSGNTAGADFIVTMDYRGTHYHKLPLEMKWVPTAGKFTLKINDLKAYVAENAAILFVYNSNPNVTDLKKRRDYNLAKHIRSIEASEEDIRWGIMDDVAVRNFYYERKDCAYPIPYMGDKMGTVLMAEDYDKWFIEEPWEL